MRTLTALLVAFGLILGSAASADARPSPLTRSELLTMSDYRAVYPDMKDAFRIAGRYSLFAPKQCEDQGYLVPSRRRNRIYGSVSMTSKKNSVALIDQSVVRLPTKRAARKLVRRYRHFGRVCKGNQHTDDGEGSAVTLKIRRWVPPRVGAQSGGFLLGWFSQGGRDWRRVLAVRVGRTVSVVDVDFNDVRPGKAGVLELGRAAAAKLR